MVDSNQQGMVELVQEFREMKEEMKEEMKDLHEMKAYFEKMSKIVESLYMDFSRKEKKAGDRKISGVKEDYLPLQDTAQAAKPFFIVLPYRENHKMVDLKKSGNTRNTLRPQRSIRLWTRARESLRKGSTSRRSSWKKSWAYEQNEHQLWFSTR